MNKTFEEHLLEFEPVLINMSRKYQIYPLEPEDIAQELRLRLLEQFDNYNPFRPFKQWAITVCQNKIRNLARDYKRNNRGKHQNLDDYTDKL